MLYLGKTKVFASAELKEYQRDANSLGYCILYEYGYQLIRHVAEGDRDGCLPNGRKIAVQ